MHRAGTCEVTKVGLSHLALYHQSHPQRVDSSDGASLSSFWVSYLQILIQAAQTPPLSIFTMDMGAGDRMLAEHEVAESSSVPSVWGLFLSYHRGEPLAGEVPAARGPSLSLPLVVRAVEP